jgi:isopropylmalate/homocitrate/citramalate synthase
MSLIKLYDTTLRDGTQAEDVSFLVTDKVRIAQKLDELGVHYVEGGWPGSNPKDIAFFKDIKKVSLRQAKIAAFGSTRRAKTSPEKDNNIRTLVQAEPDVVTIFGKTWDFHVFEALRITLEENLELIYDSLAYLKRHVAEVIYDAEHFFDGYKANPDYALKTLRAAQDAGADCLVLCDTNGGTLPHELPAILAAVNKAVTAPLGIHTHNDSECAVANSLMAVEHGIVHVQGTINGFGERCGNANLCSIIPSLRLKMGRDCVSKDPVTLEILETLKDLENKGYQFEGAEASFELLMRRALGTMRHNFSVIGFRVIDTKRQEEEKPLSEATVQVKVGGKIEHTAAEGNGPVNALDNALRKALENFYPQIRDMRLLDYKVRVLPTGKGTASITRVLIESGDKTSRWGTVGVSDNIIDASYHALIDALQYKLFKDQGNQ